MITPDASYISTTFTEFEREACGTMLKRTLPPVQYPRWWYTPDPVMSNFNSKLVNVHLWYSRNVVSFQYANVQDRNDNGAPKSSAEAAVGKPLFS